MEKRKEDTITNHSNCHKQKNTILIPWIPLKNVTDFNNNRIITTNTRVLYYKECGA